MRLSALKCRISRAVKAAYKSICSSVKRGERRYVVSALCIVSAFGMAAGVAFTGARLVYKVTYSGKDIALVTDKKTFDRAKDTVVKMVEGNNVAKAVETPEYTGVLAVSPALNNTDDIVNAIIENTDGIVEGCVFTVDGVEKFKADKKVLDACVDKAFEKYRIKGAKCTFSFVEKVEYKEGYFLKKDTFDENEINFILKDLTVKTVAETVEETVIPYYVTEVRNDDELIGSRTVVIEGRNGMSNKISTTTYINGNPVGETVVREEVVVDAVNEAVSIGTAVPICAEDVTYLPGGGYVFPLATRNWEVSAYYGDGRGHKGIDLAANHGTPILTVAAGTVIRSEWYEGYGYCVDVDHGFGFITRYGHASELIAEVGQVVQAGDCIALVGSTGDSTGDHLHIEFIVGGNKLDPALYLGLD